MLSGCGLRDTSQLITARETSHNVLALFIGACIAGRKTDCLEQRCREYRLAANVQSGHINHKLLLTHDDTTD